METFEKTYKVPSAGVFGGPTEVTIRPMTTKEEKIIYTSRDMSFIEKIVKSCIIEPKDVKISLLHPNDISFLLYIYKFMKKRNSTFESKELPKWKLTPSIILTIIGIRSISN